LADGVSLLGALGSPLYDPLREWLNNLPPEGPPGPEELNPLCNPPPLSGGGVPIRFVGPDAARARTYADQFEVRACLRGEVAVREASWHDAFNALAWLAFPHTKAAINQRHFAELESERVERGSGVGGAFSPGGKRSTVRDALTLFDESGIIVASPSAELLKMIRCHQWKPLFLGRRAEVQTEMRFFVVGHALHEKALHAYKGMTARALLLPAPASFLDLSAAMQREYVDERAAERVRRPASLNATRELPPLPVMGIPGWTDNNSPDFYDDGEVFR
jgi:hypothetical protein